MYDQFRNRGARGERTSVLGTRWPSNRHARPDPGSRRESSFTSERLKRYRTLSPSTPASTRSEVGRPQQLLLEQGRVVSGGAFAGVDRGEPRKAMPDRGRRAVDGRLPPPRQKG